MTNPLPIPASAIEAAANAMHDKHWPAQHNKGEPCSLCVGYAETACRAFCEALGMERRGYEEEYEGGLPGKWRLVSRWFQDEPGKDDGR